MGKLARRLSEYGLSAPESETPEERFERERLERRIAEEAGPVKVYKMVEEWLPESGSKGTMTVSLRKTGLFIGRAVMRKVFETAPKDCRRCRFHWNHLTGELNIEVTPEGPWHITFHGGDHKRPRVSPARAGGSTIPERLRAQGIGEGRYPARVEGNRIIVEFGKGRVAK